MSTKMVDGIYYGEEHGKNVVRFVRSDRWSCKLDNNTWPIGLHFKPLRRIADLDGRPVVDEAVIDAIAGEMVKPQVLTTYRANEILRKYLAKSHLCPSQQEAVEGEQKPSASSGSLPKNTLTEADLPGWYLCEAQFSGESGKPAETREVAIRWDGSRRFYPMGEPVGNYYTNYRLLTIAGTEAAPTTNRYLETATGEEWVFLPEDDKGLVSGIRIRDRRSDYFKSEDFTELFTPLANDAPGNPDPKLERDRMRREIASRIRDIDRRIGLVATVDWVRGELTQLADRLEFGLPTPLSPAEADAPIVDLRKFGAFPCRHLDSGATHPAWKRPGGYVVLYDDGDVASWSEQWFEQNFTRQRPLTLPPEHEKLVQPIVDKFGMDAGELRDVIAKVGV